MQETKCIGGLSNHKWGKQFHQQDRVYSIGILALALTASIPEGSYKYMEVKKLGNIYGFSGGNFDGNVYDPNSIAKTIVSRRGGIPCIVEVDEMKEEKVINTVAMRGRYKDGKIKQQLEINKENVVNSLTTAQKDNMLLIRQATKKGYITCQRGGVVDLSYPQSKTRRGRVIEEGTISPTLTTENIPSVLEDWIWEIEGILYLIRIRKLTPKECFRLMGFSDKQFEKAEKVNSNTQLYKQAGNSIVVDVLESIFLELFWDEWMEDETEMNPCLNCN